MIWRSFRLRLALLATLLAGVMLTALGAWCWVIVGRVGLGRIDREMRNRASRYAAEPADSPAWRQLDDSLQTAFGGREPGSVALLLIGPDGRSPLRSPNWPAGLDPARVLADPAAQPWRTGRLPRPPRAPRRWWRPPPPPHGDLPPPAGYPPHHRTIWVDREPWRLMVYGDLELTVVMATRLDGFVADVGRIRGQLIGGLLAGLLLAGLGGWLVAGRALRPVAALTRTVEQVTASGLDQRIAVRGEALEFERLITVFNAMLDRLQRSFEQAARFSADAAHELKTPLAILQGELEQALHDAPEDSPQQRLALALLDEVQRLKSITGRLLLLARADAGRLSLDCETVDLTELLASLAEDAQALAPDLTVDCHLTPAIRVAADAHLLAQALGNLTQNATKYNRPDGRVRIGLEGADGWAEVSVTNTGPGIPAAAQDRVFERFYRADPAHGRRVDGVGLGLSLAAEILRAHGGELVLVRSRDEETTFRARLPLA